MSFKMWIIILSVSLVASFGYKTGSNLLEDYRHTMISEQICRAAQSRLQVGSTREVVDVAHSALVATGHADAEITLKEGNSVFTESSLTSSNAVISTCEILGRENVELSLYFPKLSFFDLDLFVAFVFSLAILLILKILFSIVLKGFQNKFINETDRRLSSVLGANNCVDEKSPFWIDWLYQTDPKSILRFKNRLSKLENKIDRQANDLKNQAHEKALKEFQLIQARKFKDLTHQIRHDLRQTLGVIKSSVSTLPQSLNETGVLSGSIQSIESMIEDLKEQEKYNSQNTNEEIELIEVVLNEVVTEQRAYLGAGAEISISLSLQDADLNPVKVPSALLKRVFTNLVRNSIEAISDCGKISILVRRSEGKTVLVSIEDTGAGFSEEALKSLFKKGFTTKINGSGRGLSFCQEKIRDWGGTILVDSKSEKTRIDIELPLAELPADFVSPSVLCDIKDLIVVDDRPLKSELSFLTGGNVDFYKNLDELRSLIAAGNVIQGKTILFDLHLGHGVQSLEILKDLPIEQDYVFMTSDYLNDELIAEAQKRNFLVIPKDLMGHSFVAKKNLGVLKSAGVSQLAMQY